MFRNSSFADFPKKIIEIFSSQIKIVVFASVPGPPSAVFNLKYYRKRVRRPQNLRKEETERVLHRYLLAHQKGATTHLPSGSLSIQANGVSFFPPGYRADKTVYLFTRLSRVKTLEPFTKAGQPVYPFTRLRQSKQCILSPS